MSTISRSLQIRGLIKEGMGPAVQTRKDIHKLAVMQLETAAARKRTKVSLRALIAGLRGGGIGHTKNKVEAPSGGFHDYSCEYLGACIESLVIRHSYAGNGVKRNHRELDRAIEERS